MTRFDELRQANRKMGQQGIGQGVLIDDMYSGPGILSIHADCANDDDRLPAFFRLNSFLDP